MIKYAFATLVLLAASLGQTMAQMEETEPVDLKQQQVRGLVDKAREATLKGDTKLADKYFSELVKLARDSYQRRDVDLSASILRRVLDINPNHPDALFTLAELYRVTNPVWAVDYYNQFLRISPTNAKALFGRGSCWLARQAYALAIEDLKRLVDELDPRNVAGLANLGLALAGRAAEKGYDADMLRDAVEYVQRAVAIAEASQDKELRDMLPELRQRLAKLSFTYQRVLAEGPGGGDYKAPIGYYNEAIRAIGERILADPTNMEALGQLKSCYDGLIEVYHAQVKKDPKDPQPYLTLADLVDARTKLDVRGAYILELEYIKKAAEAAPNNLEVQTRLAGAYHKLGMVKETLATLDKAAELDPQNKAKYDEIRARLAASTRPTTQPAEAK